MSFWSLLLFSLSGCWSAAVVVQHGQLLILMHSEHAVVVCAGSTCCCMREYFGYCFTWACCPLTEATCCEDQIHCCPHNLPVCDVTAGRCLAKAGEGFDDSLEWFTKTPAQKVSTVAMQLCTCLLTTKKWAGEHVKGVPETATVPKEACQQQQLLACNTVDNEVMLWQCELLQLLVRYKSLGLLSCTGRAVCWQKCCICVTHLCVCADCKQGKQLDTKVGWRKWRCPTDCQGLSVHA